MTGRLTYEKRLLPCPVCGHRKIHLFRDRAMCLACGHLGPEIESWTYANAYKAWQVHAQGPAADAQGADVASIRTDNGCEGQNGPV